MAGGAAAPSNAVLGSSLSRSRFIVCFGLVSSLFFLWGLSYGLLDSLNKKFQDLFGITKAESTGLQGMYFGAYFVFSIPASFIIRKFGYKTGVIFGLCLFGIGALCFWPCAVKETYPGFLICTFVTACGLATLEVSANTYVSVLAGMDHASLALTFAQGFNGISAFAGPLIASRWFFTGAHNDSFTSVQYVYLAVGLFGFCLAMLFFGVRFPDVRQDISPEQEAYVKERGYWDLFRRPRLMFGFAAETLYVGAQVAVASLAINYFNETTNVSTAQAANLFSYCQMAFMAGRFISVPILHYSHPPLVLGVYGALCALFAILVSQISGTAGAAMLFLVFFFESICYPVIFAESTMGLGPYASAGGCVFIIIIIIIIIIISNEAQLTAFAAMGVAGGAWYPSVQATLADDKTTQLSYIVAMAGYVAVSAYGFGLWWGSCRANGFHWRVLAAVEDQTLRPTEVQRAASVKSADLEKADERQTEHVLA
ncbi:MFS general substrate transporter [Leucosporidium creatinivorum]|uniref:MFS general substrate transporter n=1 Tax=Leucosporidium creatinivorum TaxID=106004 RepID=A0A1Y2G2U6_9BASI|nr:MFS general substrate transporter [Leucosporidium creatinivorum]